MKTINQIKLGLYINGLSERLERYQIVYTLSEQCRCGGSIIDSKCVVCGLNLVCVEDFMEDPKE